MKKTLLLFLACVLLSTFVKAQAPTGVVKKTKVVPVIDGVVDAVWADANVYNIDRPFSGMSPSLGGPGQTNWKALWTNNGIYILLQVLDDVFSPAYAGTEPWQPWMYDVPEIYFDVNTVKQDGLGAKDNQGHYDLTPTFTAGKIDGSLLNDNGMDYAFLVTGPAYNAEYFVPFSKIKDKNWAEVDKTLPIGFDVYINDNDNPWPTRSLMTWANSGAVTDNWTNMDDAGTITLEPGIPVSSIVLDGGTITTENGTLQIASTIEPSDAFNKNLKWMVVNGTGLASISANGLLTALDNGTVTVKATALDGSLVEAAPIEVTISGQVFDKNDFWNGLNQISNWNFDTDLSGWGGWVDGGVPGQVPPIVQDGVSVMKVGLASDGNYWHYSTAQTSLTCEANAPYTLKFKSWSSANAPCVVAFESDAIGGDQYNNYGASPDSESAGGRSKWNYITTTVPTWFTFHVTFDQIVPATIQKIQWMLSLSNETIYLDSVLLIKDSEVPVSSIALQGGTITTDNGTLQVGATIEPAFAINKNLKWTVVNGTGKAKISASGLLTAIANGMVTVKASALDGSLVEADPIEVSISGQQIDENDFWNGFNQISNWNFDTSLSGWGGNVDGGLPGAVAPVVQGGVTVMKVGFNDNPWFYTLYQRPLACEPNAPYTLKFKSWSSANAPCVVDFESDAIGGDQYNRFGASPDVESAGGRSEWHYNTTTVPTWFTFHVTFDQIVPATIQKLQWMLSLSNETIYLDSVLLVKDAEVPVSSIVLQGGAVTTDNGTFQVGATIEPAFAINKNLKWTVVNGTGRAKISSTGLLTAISNGAVTVKAAALDGSLVEADPVEVTISGQQIDKNDIWDNLNLISNWNFNTDLTSWGGGWVDGDVPGQVAPVIQGGVSVMKVGLASDGNQWHYSIAQSPLHAEPNVPYTFKFKSWSSANAPCAVDFESMAIGGDRNALYGASLDIDAEGGRSRWHYNTTPTPTWFTYHVTFDQILPTTVQNIMWLLSLSNETIYLDSVLLVKDADYLGFTIDSKTTRIGYEGGSATTNISTYMDWTSSSDQSWLTVAPSSGSASQTLMFTAGANPLLVPRTAIVTVSATGFSPQTITVTQASANNVPTASAGPDQSITEGLSVTLDGTASSDLDNQTLIFKWTTPEGVKLNSNTTSKPKFSAPIVTKDTDYTFQLTVFDGSIISAPDFVVITIKNINNKPSANAGSDQSVNEGTTTTLDASGSTDLDNDELTYLWTAPEGIVLSSATESRPTFTAPEVTTNINYSFTLVVNDGKVDSSVDQVVIAVANVDHAPYVMNAIRDVSVDKGSLDQIIDLKTVFADEDLGDVLVYSVSSNVNDQVVKAIVTGTNLTLSFSKEFSGLSEIAIKVISNGKETSSKFNVEVKIPTGIVPLSVEPEVQVYPNPTKGNVQLKFSQTPKTDTWVTIYSISGKVIFKSLAVNKEENLNLKGNPTGLYFIKVDQKISKTFKIVLE
jgi:hypothetical protein